MEGPAVLNLAGEFWSGRRGSNPQPTAWEAATLPLSYSRFLNPIIRCRFVKETGARRPPARHVQCICLKDILGRELHLAGLVVQNPVRSRIQASEAGRLNALGTEGVVSDHVKDILCLEPELEILFLVRTE